MSNEPTGGGLPFTGERMVPAECARTSLYLEHVTRYRLAARLARGRRVLDAATGAGYGAALLAEAGAASVVGIDADAGAVAYAGARYTRAGVAFRVDDVTRLVTVPDGSIDLYVCLETIEHVADGEAVVREAARVLSPGGILFLSTPNWEVSRCQNPFHKREYRADELRALLGARFPHVALLAQRTLFANRIAAPGDPSPGEILLEEDAAPALPAPYLLAVASREPVEVPAALLALGSSADTEHMNQYIQNLEGGVAERDERIAALAASERVLRGETARLEDALAESEARRGAADAARAAAEEREAAIAAERESRNRYIQNLEGGVAERDARIRDLEMALGRREMAIALRLVNAMIRVNRLLGRIPTRAYRWVRHALREARRDAPRLAPRVAPAIGSPLFSVIVPVHDNFEFLGPSIESALSQTWPDYEVVLYDDASGDPRVRPLLESHRANRRARVLLGETNLGISGATNRGIAAAAGRFLAFLDCDDLLEPNALERVARHLERHPDADFVYTNRVDVDETDRVVERWDFVNRSFGPPAEELLKGMFASHLKVVRREAFRRVGIFRSEFDSVQDYDLALRLSEACRFSFLRETLYRHRVHPGQTTQQALERQRLLAERAKERALLRRRIAAGETDLLVSIVVLSLNRVEDTERCLDAVARRTPFRREVILVDNGSAPGEVARLRRLVEGRDGVTLHELPENLGCGGGRNFGAARARGAYVVFLDNDIEVREGWLAHLLEEVEADPALAACCCRAVFPDGIVQFTGGRARFGGRRVRFDLVNTGRREEDLGTLEVQECDWIPGGATIFRKAVLDAHPYDPRIAGAYEDNDWSLAVRRSGYRLAGCPLATVTHHHMNFSPRAQRDAFYRSQRYNRDRLERTLLAFQEKHGAFIEEEDLYRYLGFAGSEAFIEAALAAQRARG